ncbi:hypothetical protein R8Y01_002224 [Acinetobacter baumannii]|uniref:hypothetical protein n=1 Tax=Acinetobacter baumannii TaxID=470 RepID=UPI001EE7CFDE|nr:hypothetical protein [Acinetobacter baumannii]ELT4632926.1 hypothetical protein [Acinetobacter baumannii]MCG5791250.1 hypothetical protein [Acinetobacter baumannii]
MSFGRTNATAVMVATYIEENPQEDIRVTVVAGGQLITGQLITEDDFFSLNDNLGLQDNFNKHIRDERNRIINQIDDGNTTEELSDMLAEDFLYLKNAGYISGGVTYFNNDPDGYSVQIRISDISAFTYRGLNPALKA